MSEPSSEMHEIKVYVTDQIGRKVSGATVGALTWSDCTIEDATTSDGVATLHVPHGLELDRVAVLKSGVGFDYWLSPGRESPVDATTDLPDEVHLVLAGAKTVTVKVVGSESEPLAGVGVAPWFITVEGKRDRANLSGWRAADVATDAHGVATFDWLPTAQVEQALFILRSKEYNTIGRASLNANDPDGTELEITAYRPGRISGKVTLPIGAGAPDILLRIHGGGCASSFRSEVRTGADGTYSIDAGPERSYVVGVLDDRWAAKSRMGIEVTEGQQCQGVDLELITGTVISGRYTIGPDCEPGPDEIITLIEIGPEPAACRKAGACGPDNLSRWTKTDNDGRYCFRVGPGKYQLYAPGHVKDIDLLVTDEARIDHDFHSPAPLRGMLSGVVVRESDGATAPQAAVRGQPIIISHTGLDTRCDGNGEFAEERWNDRMIVWAHSPDGSLAGTAEISETDTSVRVEVSPAVVAVVKVVDAKGNPAGREDMVYWMNTEFADGADARFQVTSQTDASGMLQMPGLLPGSRCQVASWRALSQEGYKATDFVAELDSGQVLQLGDIILPAESSSSVDG